jgi:hypothetical protein
LPCIEFLFEQCCVLLIFVLISFVFIVIHCTMLRFRFLEFWYLKCFLSPKLNEHALFLGKIALIPQHLHLRWKCVFLSYCLWVHHELCVTQFRPLRVVAVVFLFAIGNPHYSLHLLSRYLAYVFLNLWNEWDSWHLYIGVVFRKST